MGTESLELPYVQEVEEGSLLSFNRGVEGYELTHC